MDFKEVLLVLINCEIGILAVIISASLDPLDLVGVLVQVSDLVV